MATTRLLSAMVATWNNVATTFTGLKFNVTDTASASGSLLMDLQVGGVSQFKVDKTAGLSLGGNNSATVNLLASNAEPRFYMSANAGRFSLGSVGQISWGSTTNAAGGLDLSLTRDAANTLALRNGTAAQKFNVYNTYTDASNYERGYAGWAGNIFRIGTIKAGTGVARNLSLETDSTSRWQIDTSGHFIAVTDNTYDIGASGANRPRNLYVANTIIGTAFVGNAANGFNFSSRGFIVAPANGVFKLSDQADADFNLLQFGGTTSSFPAIKRSTTGLQVRLADDSAFAPLASSTVTTSDTAFLHNTSAALANGAAAQLATMTNGPTAGNPTKWIAINDNGTTRYIPAW